MSAGKEANHWQSVSRVYYNKWLCFHWKPIEKKILSKKYCSYIHYLFIWWFFCAKKHTFWSFLTAQKKDSKKGSNFLLLLFLYYILPNLFYLLLIIYRLCRHMCVSCNGLDYLEICNYKGFPDIALSYFTLLLQTEYMSILLEWFWVLTDGHAGPTSQPV